MFFLKYLRRCFGILLIAFIGVQLFFVLYIVSMNILPVRSTAFERTSLLRLIVQKKSPQWKHEWTGYDQIAESLKRAVVASEDSRFGSHYGIEWDAIMGAWEYNKKMTDVDKSRGSQKPSRTSVPIRGGSTITQQLAKNLFLSPEQTYLRKAQELLITLTLETFLSKERLLELYLNHAEWGAGVYGIQAASQHYYKKSSVQLTPREAAMLAAMLPNPKYYESHRESAYLKQRMRVIMNGMPLVNIP